MRPAGFLLALLLTVCASLATWLDPRAQALSPRAVANAGLLETLMGDSRRLFATHFLLKADAYFHSGAYPGIFDDRAALQENHLAETASGHASTAGRPEDREDHDHHHDDDHDPAAQNDERSPAYLGTPRDWIDRFSRHFFPMAHTHLGAPESDDHNQGHDHAHHDHDHDDHAPAGVGEILPWLKIAAELDPNRIETYVVTAYWLRTRQGKVDEAESFLRDGLRANHGNPAILFELGRIRAEARRDDTAARNVWELALQKWQEQEAPKPEPDKLLLAQIAGQLAALEDRAGHFDRAIGLWQIVKANSAHPEEIEKRIAEVRSRQPAPTTPRP